MHSLDIEPRFREREKPAVPCQPLSRSHMPLTYRVLHFGSPSDVADLQHLFEQALSYSLLVAGQLPSPNAAAEALIQVPPSRDLTDKFFYGAWLGTELVGCADVIRGYPDSTVAYLGLLLLSERRQGAGLGSEALDFVRAQARSWGCRTLRISVIGNNTRALAFWKRMGFRELHRKPAPGFTDEAIVMEDPL